MHFAIITDTSTNLPARYLRASDVTAVPFSYFVEEEEHLCPAADEFDGRAFYDQLRQGTEVKTALINEQRYTDYFEPVLQAGQDILFVGMSSGISGSMQVAKLAAHELCERYPDRKIVVMDTMAASLGGSAARRGEDAGGDGGGAAAAARACLSVFHRGRSDVPAPRRPHFQHHRRARHGAWHQAAAQGQ